MATGSSCKCVIHVGPALKEDVKPFDDRSWFKLMEAKTARQTKLCTSKYTALCEQLPDIYDATIGYHSTCYKNFTAFRRIEPTRPESEHRENVLRSDATQGTASSSGIFPNKCIFCNRVRLRVKNKDEKLGICETREAEMSIKAAATRLNDSLLLSKITNTDFVAKEVRYHHSCRRNYLHKASLEEPAMSDENVDNRALHAQAFEKLAEYISNSVIENCHAEFMHSVHARYLGILEAIGGQGTGYKVCKLTEKISKYFGSKVKVENYSKKEGNVLYRSDMDKQVAIDDAKTYASSDHGKITEAALIIRSAVLALRRTCKQLPDPLTPGALAEGQAEPPDVLKHFFTVLFTGSGKQVSDTRTERFVGSAAQNAVFVTTRGVVKPAKHLCLGLGLKSLTGSRKVLEIMNHFGHCVSYHVVEELETNLATTVLNKEKATPYGMLLESGLATSVAFNNYDENSETLSGEGTLHDTVGICIQNCSSNNPDILTCTASQSQYTETSKKRKRSLEIEEKELEPYRKKPKLTSFNYRIYHGDSPPNLPIMKHRDVLWMVSVSECETTPM